jgi:hypothetical protein
MTIPAEIRRLTLEQKDELKRKLLEGKRFRAAEIQGIATAYDVPTHMVRKALRQISSNLTEEEAARLLSNGAP